MQRENIFNEYEDAQQILKIEELIEEFPEEVEKHLPCAVVSSSAETIQNEVLPLRSSSTSTTRARSQSTPPSRSPRSSARATAC